MDYFGNIKIKWTYATHRVDHSAVHGLVPMSGEADPGRIVLGRITTLGKHRDVEGIDGRRVILFPGDVIAGVLAYRYATDQYEGHPIASGTAGHLLSIGGGCRSIMRQKQNNVHPTA